MNVCSRPPASAGAIDPPVTPFWIRQYSVVTSVGKFWSLLRKYPVASCEIRWISLLIGGG